MGLEDKHLDILQNIEFGIVLVYRENPDMRDLDVIKALEALTKHYTRKKLGKPVEDPELEGLSEQVFTSAEGVLSMREDLGNKKEAANRPSFSRALREPTQEEIFLACLRKIEKSAKRWNKREGGQGYLNFVKDYVK